MLRSSVRSHRRARHRVPIRLPEGLELSLSPGKHNEVQKAVVEEFAPRFAPGALLLYLGDTEDKNLWVDEDGLKAAGIVAMTDRKTVAGAPCGDSRPDTSTLVSRTIFNGLRDPCGPLGSPH